MPDRHDQLWQSLDEHTAAPKTPRPRTDEFPADATHWPPDLSRRRFFEVMGASLALAGASGCRPRPPKAIVPYVTRPPEAEPGIPLYYATAIPWQGYARGVLAESHLGRPTKLEGNPDHPDSLGATDVVTQAAVLDLYDPDRSRAPRRERRPAAWEEFERTWLEEHRTLSANQGRGLGILTEPTTSPTSLRLIHRLLDRFPAAQWYQHTSLPRFDRHGSQLEFDPAAADVILSVADDFLHAHPASLRYARAFTQRRRADPGQPPLNRLHVIEPTPTITGAMADHRLPVAPARLTRVVVAIAAELGTPGVATEPGAGLSATERDFVRLVAQDLRTNQRTAVALAGAELPGPIHQTIAAINHQLGRALGSDAILRRRPAVRSDADPRAAGALRELTAALDAGEVRTLLILGGNPCYTAPADIPFEAALARAGLSVHLGPYFDETAAACVWHLPESHFLESWADLRAFDGIASIVQPVIEPMFQTRTRDELLDLCAAPPGRAAYDLVRETWEQLRGGTGFVTAWHTWLRAGVIPGSADPEGPATPDAELAAPVATPAENTGAVEHVLFRADPNVWDGRWTNNAWLQEIPRPLSSLVWDNAALISPALAARLDLHNGDVVALSASERSLETPVWIMPGQADDCVTLHFGYGRPRAGAVGENVGFDAYRLRTADTAWEAPLTALRPTGRRHPLVSTQGHFRMEGRDPVRIVPAGRAADGFPHTVPSHEEQPQLFPEWPNPRYAWGMVIDLRACIGCNACTIACQAENNIPVVGREQVARGREMHWIRVDRYFAGEPGNPRFVHQPVPCMQCETAPCELVCPVHATVHSSEGLNDMVYNRCIGTRYCSNNCPYKVRRFNFLDYQLPTESLANLQKNPDVTIRARGVMEKCTYCVQRINAGRIQASKEHRLIRDGEIMTACQQVCPTEAIVFGDLQTAGSRVATLRAHPLNYGLLEELNTRPRTTYIARVINPARESEDEASS